jgi:hypothetical protein
MSRQASVEVLKEFPDAFNRHGLDSIMSYFADDCVFNVGVSEWTLTGTAVS